MNDIESVEKMDDLLYKACFIEKDEKKTNMTWQEVKEDENLLASSIKVVKDKFGEHDVFAGYTIVYALLTDYRNVNKEIYQKAVDLIYSNQDLARMVIDGYSNGGYSFLLVTLFNENLILTPEQKAFAIEEAMNKIGTTKQRNLRKSFESSLETIEKLKDNPTVMLEFGPLGAKEANMYFYDMMSGLGTDQAHGSGDFDIRYWILRNHNFTLEEKQKLVYDFYNSDDEYSNCLDEWEWGIVNNNLDDDSIPLVDIDDVYHTPLDEIKEKLEGDVDSAIEDIKMIRLMHRIRPANWEKELVLGLEKKEQ